ncbi:hypothetical protein [Stakelama marina]|uniref:Uncharacterized protein n=1 Tax=Stakelama marina TaxID=2826939 RepID=A0A8T4I9X0_9SPHN|nr:hypothetical protein [Stakelama marina]MBR0551447.1 hypothetical protein [Stakelama marina]
MADDSSDATMDRIEKALARIEKAAAARAFAADSIARRHAKLRARMEEAVQALDELIERQDGKGADE